MRNNTIVPVASFRALFTELIPCTFLYPLLRRCGVRRRCPPVVSAWQLIQGLIFHVVAEAGTLAQHVKQLTGKTITDGALAQRRALLPIAVFEQMMEATLQPKGEPTRHPEAFYQGLRLCGVDGSLFSVTNTPQNKKQMRKAQSRRGRAAFPKVGVAVMVELGLHNPLAAALGAKGESEIVLAQQVLSAQPEQSLLINDRYYGVPELLVGLPAERERHFWVRVKKNLTRRLLEVYPDGSALVEIRSSKVTRLVREILGRVQRGGRGPATTVRLWTSLLDWRRCPAAELLALYARRWEQEVFYKELKVDMRSTPCLQSHTPLTAMQEIAALILAYAVVGGLPHRGRHSGRCRCAADQFYEDPASGARVVAVLGGLCGLADPGAGALGRPPFLAPDCGYGHPQATATVLPTSVAPTGEQLATVTQKHLPQRACPILRWPNLCLNPYTALGLIRTSFGGRSWRSANLGVARPQ